MYQKCLRWVFKEELGIPRKMRKKESFLEREKQ